MVSLNSKKQYLQTYLSLIKKANSSDMNDLYDYIVKSKVKDNTKLSYLNSIISLKKIDSELVTGDLKDISELRDKLNIKIEKAREVNNITESQEVAMNKINLNDLKKFVEELAEAKDNSIRNLEDYLLIKLMVEFPLRNDLQEIRLTTHKQDLKTPFNVIYIPKSGKSILSLKEFKTARKEGEIIIDIPIDISDDIRKLIKLDKFRKFLFVNRDNNPLSSSSFTHKLNSLFKKRFGIPISSTIIRKIYLSGKYSGVLEEMKEDARVMGHSTQTAQKIYISNKKIFKKDSEASDKTV